MKNFKRIICVALSLLFVFSLAACTREINIEVNCNEGVSKLLSNILNSKSAPAQNQNEEPVVQPTEVPDTTEPVEVTDETNGDTPTTTEPKKENKNSKKANSGELTASSSKEEVVAKYAEVYNNTKAKGTLQGHTNLICTSVKVDGKENSFVKKIADIAISEEGTSVLPPSTETNPGLKCAVKPSDIKAYKFTDNGNGTATIRLDVKDTKNSKRFKDPAGDMLDVMEDVTDTVAKVPALSFAEGDISSNVTLISSGYCEITYDKSTNLITKGTYVLYTQADITHVNVKPLVNDKSGSASFEYTVELPG